MTQNLYYMCSHLNSSLLLTRTDPNKMYLTVYQFQKLPQILKALNV
jgi:hypothetical protein